MDPFISASLIKGGANVLGSIFGLGSQSSANATNLKIAQMNNEFNERMLLKQMEYNDKMFGKQTEYDWKKMQEQNSFNRDFAFDMFNAENEYNTAANQRKRLEEAGLNPYLMMSGGNAGIASGQSASAGSGGAPSAQGIHPPTATPVHVQPLDYGTAFSRIASTVGDYYQMKNLDAQTKQLQSITEGQDIDNKFKAVRTAVELLNVMSGTDKNKAETANKLIENGFLPALLNVGVRKGESEISLNASVEALNRVNEAKGQKELKWIDEQAAANIALTMSATYKNYKEAQKAVAEKIESEARTRGIDINTEQARAIAGHLVSKAFFDSVQSEKRAELIGTPQSFSVSGNASVSLPGVSVGAGGSYSESKY